MVCGVFIAISIMKGKDFWDTYLSGT
jgi:hypothetical protein